MSFFLIIICFGWLEKWFRVRGSDIHLSGPYNLNKNIIKYFFLSKFKSLCRKSKLLLPNFASLHKHPLHLRNILVRFRWFWKKTRLEVNPRPLADKGQLISNAKFKVFICTKPSSLKWVKWKNKGNLMHQMTHNY